MWLAPLGRLLCPSVLPDELIVTDAGRARFLEQLCKALEMSPLLRRYHVGPTSACVDAVLFRECARPVLAGKDREDPADTRLNQSGSLESR